jgi:hypothetical protein
MTRLLKVWNLRYPSCHRFCFRLTSCVKRHRNSATGAVCEAGSCEACGVLRRGAVIASTFVVGAPSCVTRHRDGRPRSGGVRDGGCSVTVTRRAGWARLLSATVACDLARHYASHMQQRPPAFSGDASKAPMPSRTRNRTGARQPWLDCAAGSQTS